MNVERKNSLIWLSLVFIGLLSSQYYVLINNKYHLAWWGLMLIGTGLIIALKQMFEIHHKRLSSIMIIIYWLLAIISWTGFNIAGALPVMLIHLPVNAVMITFMNEHFKLIIGGSIMLLVVVLGLLAWLLAQVQIISYQQALIRLLKYYFSLLISETILVLISALVGWSLNDLVFIKALNILLIVGLTGMQLLFLTKVWQLPIQVTPIPFVGTLIVMSIGGYMAWGITTWQLNNQNKQEIIAHRGIYNAKQQPNSIKALKQTALKKFDYVEMDVRETKDHQFIVVHDDVLGQKPIEDQSLKQLQQQHRIIKFTDYLKVANEQGQKLMIELKPGKLNQVGRLFVQRYKNELLKNKSVIESMNPDYVKQVKYGLNDISAGIIMTVNIGDLTKFTTDFYSVQYFGTTLPFLAQAKRTQRPVYVWTAKRKLTMAILNSLAIDGQISDYGAQNRYLTKDYRLNRVALLINTGINYL